MEIIKIKASDLYEKTTTNFWLLFESSIKLSNGSPFIRNQIYNLSTGEQEQFFGKVFQCKKAKRDNKTEPKNEITFYLERVRNLFWMKPYIASKVFQGKKQRVIKG